MNYFSFYGVKNRPKSPWSKYYKEGAMEIKEAEGTLYNYIENKILDFKDRDCIDYYGNKITYNELLKMVDNCAKSFYNSGIRKGDIITICVPNTIEGIVTFLAANKIGAIANFIHPSCSENEIKDSLKETNSKIVVIIDINYIKIKNIISETDVHKVVLVNLCGYMPFATKLKHSLKEKLKIKFSKFSMFIWWDDFILHSEKLELKNYAYNGDKNEPAMILHSGGTTGAPKGVVLSNSNLISYIEIAMVAQEYLGNGDRILALMPIFHGFGIIYCVMYPLCIGMNIILRPRFEAKDYCKMIKKYKPQVLTGVPTLFESILKEWNEPNLKLDFLKAALVGGDSLKPSLRERINIFFKQHESDVKVIEGYGCTEAVCGVVQGFTLEKENTTGIPLPGVYVGIFNSEDDEVTYGEEGEICVCGPTVMLGYYNNIEETNKALHIHKDGNVWLHTGDIGSMDQDGYVTYTSRLKRMIVSSGYNVYPNRIEKLLESHPAVKQCTVVGISHKYKMEVPKAFIVLKNGYTKSEFLLMDLKKMCLKNLPKYSWPYEYEFMETLPTTRVGKIDFIKLKNMQKEEKDK